MNLSSLSVALAATLLIASNDSTVSAFSLSKTNACTNAAFRSTALPSLAVAADSDEAVSSVMDFDGVNGLTFRELQRACKEKSLPATGNTATLRNRLLESLGISNDLCVGDAEECDPELEDIQFTDEGDKLFEFNALLDEVNEKAAMGHWKAATRKLKKLSRRYATPENPIPQETYVAVLDACIVDRLHGARASEPARKILEEMVANGYSIPAVLANQCVLNSLGKGPNGTHDGFGGIDTSLAMLAAMESSSKGSEMITVDTYGAVVSALSFDGAVDEALLLLRAMVVEHFFTPPLSVLADVATAAAKSKDHAEDVLQVMTLAKASGYILDNIASAEAGRALLASGVIAAEQMDNIALGLRFLTAAQKAEGCLPDRGDDLVVSSSKAAQRASAIIHSRALDKAVRDDNWKLAVKLLQLKKERSLTITFAALRKTVTVCAKNDKSKRATSFLLEWIQMAEEGTVEKPPINVFNNVVNACEMCGEEELTLVVLEALRKTHGTTGNIVTTNIALKRLAKLGNTIACEGLIIGMLQENIEPNVVTYTTAMGACVKAGDSTMAYEWMRRMRTRNVNPNYHTYNTALAACLDGKLESTVRGSTIATEMMVDVARELNVGFKGNADYNSSMPDSYTKVLARSLMKQLREHWRAGDINMSVAKSTLRVPLLKLVDFDKSEAAKSLQKQKDERVEDEALEDDDTAIDLKTVNELTKEHRRMEV